MQATDIASPTMQRSVVPDDCPHEKAQRQANEQDFGGPTMSEVATDYSKIWTALCMAGSQPLVASLLMCCQPTKQRALFIWGTLSLLTAIVSWIVSAVVAHRCDVFADWGLTLHVLLPLFSLAIAVFGVYDISEEEMRDEAFASSTRSSCDRMGWRRALVLVGTLGLLAIAFCACNLVWFYVPNDDLEFLHTYKNPDEGTHRHHHHSDKPTPSPKSGSTGVGPGWLKTPSPTPAPSQTPSPSFDPAIVLRLEHIDRSCRASVGFFFSAAMILLASTVWFDWWRQTATGTTDVFV